MEEVVQDFAEDGVTYLELRTTPRRDVFSAREYVNAVTQALGRMRTSRPEIECRLLLSINRAQPKEYAKDTVDLAIELSKEGSIVIGVDLSGNPTAGNACDSP